MTNLQDAVEIYLASLPPDEWRALVARVRDPSEPLPTDNTLSPTTRTEK